MFAVYKKFVHNWHKGKAGVMSISFTELMCEIEAQWLISWAVNQEHMSSNPTETIFIFYLFTHSLNSVVFANKSL